MKSLRLITPYFAMLLVLFASSQFMVGMHFCQGDVQGIALFKEAPACEHKAQLPPCHAKTMEGCCDDEVIIHESAGFMLSTSGFNMEVPFTTLTIVYPLLLNLADAQFSNTISFLVDHPPNGIKPNILLLIQSFLI
jgi:hypothetical protein